MKYSQRHGSSLNSKTFPVQVDMSFVISKWNICILSATETQVLHIDFAENLNIFQEIFGIWLKEYFFDKTSVV